MQRNSSDFDAAIQEAVGVTGELLEALHLVSDLGWDDDVAVLHVRAWRSAISVQRELVRLAVLQHRPDAGEHAA
jgi:hypothetical protein